MMKAYSLGEMMRVIAVASSMVTALLLASVISADGQDNSANLAKYQKLHREFTTTTGHTYKTEGIQKVSAAFISVITDDGIVRIKTGDMPPEFLRLFGLNPTKLREAQKQYARKRYDSKKAAFRKKNAERSVSARKFRLSLTVFEEIEHGFICDAQYVEDVAKTVKVRVKTGTLSRDQQSDIRRKEVEEARAVGLVEKMLVRGLPKSLKVGSPWEGDVYMVGVYVYKEKSKIPGRTGPPMVDIPMAFVKYKDAVAFRAATPADGSEGDTSGTGLAIGKQGYILTSYRLVLEADSIMVTVPGVDRPLKAKVIVKDSKENLAVLNVSSVLKPASLSMAPRITLGQPVFTLGYPDIDMRNRQLKFTEGNVAALKGVQDDSRFIQIEGDFQSGNFGGGLFNEKGVVIGVITPNPPESFFLEKAGTDFEPLQYVTKGTRLKGFLTKLSGFKPETAAPEDPKVAAQDAAVLVTVKRKKR